MTRREPDHPVWQRFDSSVLSRRSFLKRAVVVSASLPTLAGLLAACEDEDELDDEDVAAEPEDDDPEPDTDEDEPEPDTDDDPEPDTDDDQPEPDTDDDPEPDTDDDEPEDDDQFMRAPEPDPQYGGILRTAYGITVSHFDFHQGGGGPLVMAFDNLVAWNMTDGFDTIVGELAESWELSEDGTVYTFEVRQGVSFHDGTPFSAEDVVATFERIVFPPEGISSPERENLATVSEINLVDEYTMEFVLEHPWPPFVQALTGVPMVIYSKQHLEENDYDMRPAG